MYARIVNGHVREVVSFDPHEPVGLYPSDWVWVECPDDTRQGADYDPKTGAFDNPDIVDVVPAPVPPSAPVYQTTMTPIRFKAQFPISAQVKIKRARAYVDKSDTDTVVDERKAFARDVLDVLFGSLDDPRLTEVDVSDPTVVAGVDFVLSLGILTSEEADTIKRGVEVRA